MISFAEQWTTSLSTCTLDEIIFMVKVVFVPLAGSKQEERED